MPTVEFSFPELLKFLEKDFKPDELKEKISMLGVDLEKIDNETIIMEIFPNRPDLLSIEGFSRNLKGLLNVDLGIINYSIKKSEVKLFVDKSVEKVRPEISGALIKNLNITEEFLLSLMDLQEKLHLTYGRNRRKVAIGLHDFSKVRAPFFYKAVFPEEVSFIPLDMTEKLNLKEILKKHPKGKEYAFTLEGKEKYPIILDSQQNVLSFPQIINSSLTKISEETKELFIDVTGTERGAVEKALSILVTAIADREGRIYYVEIL